MTFHDERLRRHTILPGAAVRVRFCGWAILVACALLFCAAAARGQSLAPDQAANTSTYTTAPLFDATGAGAQTPAADPSAEIFIYTTELNPRGDSGDSPLPDAPVPSAPAPNPFAYSPNQSAPYEPITGRERLAWIVTGTLWPRHLAGGVFTAAFGTAVNHPREYGPHWGGFGERFGIRLTGVATSNLMEAGIGALWSEDPRYFRVPEYSFGARVKNTIKMTFLARRRDGNFTPAYARYIAYAGNNFLSNTWRADSEADTEHALIRTAEGFGGRLASNAWDEFWPDAKAHIFRRGK